MQITPYLDFDGRCEEALEFYKQALGAEVGMIMRYKDAPDQPPPGMVAPNSENKILHSSFTISGGIIMATDGYAGGTPNFAGVSLAVNVRSEADVDRMFNGLADGGQVMMPPGATFFSKRFAMLTDKFGVAWMLNVPSEQSGG